MEINNVLRFKESEREPSHESSCLWSQFFPVHILFSFLVDIARLTNTHSLLLLPGSQDAYTALPLQVMNRPVTSLSHWNLRESNRCYFLMIAILLFSIQIRTSQMKRHVVQSLRGSSTWSFCALSMEPGHLTLPGTSNQEVPLSF